MEQQDSDYKGTVHGSATIAIIIILFLKSQLFANSSSFLGLQEPPM